MHRLFLSKLILTCSLALSSAMVFALPSPKDIDAAVSAGHLSQAESMLREVIQEKPQSAKAHYELGQVLAREARYADAQMALKKAKELDPSLKFAASPEKFNETFDKVTRMAQAPSGPTVSSGLSPTASSPAGAATPANPPITAPPMPEFAVFSVVPASIEHLFAMSYQHWSKCKSVTWLCVSCVLIRRFGK